MSSATPITAKEVRFIKLGRGAPGRRAVSEGANAHTEVRMEQSHITQACLSGDWAAIEAHWKQQRPAEATKIVNQTKDFYTLGSNALWITFYKRKTILVLR